MPRILIVEDKDSLRAVLEEMLKAEGLEVVGVENGSLAVDRLRRGDRFDLVLTDWKLPGANGLAVLDAAIEADSTLPVLVMTAFGSIETAVEAMKHGAEDFITKPVDPDLLRLMVRRCLERKSRSRQSLLFAEAQSRFLPPIVGESAAIRAVRAETERVAATDATVLLEGESGTGKELFARAIHALSHAPGRGVRRDQLRRHSRDAARERALRPRARILHGRRPGGAWASSSSATRARSSWTRSASSRRSTQGKLLRVLQERSFHRVGGTVPITVDVRIIAASNRAAGEAGRPGGLSRGPLLSRSGLSDPHPGAAPAARGHRSADRLVSGAPAGRAGQAARAPERRRP